MNLVYLVNTDMATSLMMSAFDSRKKISQGHSPDVMIVYNCLFKDASILAFTFHTHPFQTVGGGHNSGRRSLLLIRCERMFSSSHQKRCARSFKIQTYLEK